MVPDYFSSYFIFRFDTLTHNLRVSAARLPSLSPALVIVKEVCPIAQLYCGIVCPWIFDSRSLLNYGFNSSLM